ncbi:hypothetical protein CVH10_23180, partial [Halomonas sp. ND22Bw]|uniref:hypothetical protein n=1 Tax=Halomonas sp. ND22Bw TaxID=2054178 RepID=UPI000D2CF14D
MTITKPGLPTLTPLQFEMDIPHYAEAWAQVVKKHGGWNPATKTLTPVKQLAKLDQTATAKQFGG